MELREALTHIAEIRLRLTRSEVFRGYRSMPVAMSGLLAVFAAIIQPAVAPDPSHGLDAWLFLWGGIAFTSIALTGVAILIRDQFKPSSTSRAITRLAVGQFVPSLIAGALLTFVIVRTSPDNAWMLPGLWQILFSQGIFASCRLLPRSIVGVAWFYLGSGLFVLVVGRDEWALAPWTMAGPFAVGQLATAIILYWTLERHDRT